MRLIREYLELYFRCEHQYPYQLDLVDEETLASLSFLFFFANDPSCTEGIKFQDKIFLILELKTAQERKAQTDLLWSKLRDRDGETDTCSLNGVGEIAALPTQSAAHSREELDLVKIDFRTVLAGVLIPEGGRHDSLFGTVHTARIQAVCYALQTGDALRIPAVVIN